MQARLPPALHHRLDPVRGLSGSLPHVPAGLQREDGQDRTRQAFLWLWTWLWQHWKRRLLIDDDQRRCFCCRQPVGAHQPTSTLLQTRPPRREPAQHTTTRLHVRATVLHHRQKPTCTCTDDDCLHANDGKLHDSHLPSTSADSSDRKNDGNEPCTTRRYLLF